MFVDQFADKERNNTSMRPMTSVAASGVAEHSLDGGWSAREGVSACNEVEVRGF